MTSGWNVACTPGSLSHTLFLAPFLSPILLPPSLKSLSFPLKSRPQTVRAPDADEMEEEVEEEVVVQEPAPEVHSDPKLSSLSPHP